MAASTSPTEMAQTETDVTMTSDAYKQNLQSRMARWRTFHDRNEPGDLMACMWWDRGPSLEAFLTEHFLEHGTDAMLREPFVDEIIGDYVARRRDAQSDVLDFDDDCVPTALVYWGIGCCNAAVTGGEPYHDGMTSWFEPELEWDRIADLKFDPDNKWVQFALHVNQAIWRRWDEDLHVLPFLYRSPLDMANGVRGNALFEEMYTDPQAVHGLIDWCVDWTLEMERFLEDNSGRTAPDGWGRAVWATWLPDGAVFVNGDPVGLISPEMALEFEQPYTAKLFENTGGGFYHNHTVGLYQTEMVARTPNNLIQYFVDDPRQPSTAQALQEIPELRDKILASSLDTPIGMAVWGEQLDAILDIVKDGRFLLVLSDDESKGHDHLQGQIDKIRRASNLD